LFEISCHELHTHCVWSLKHTNVPHDLTSNFGNAVTLKFYMYA